MDRNTKNNTSTIKIRKITPVSQACTKILHILLVYLYLQICYPRRMNKNQAQIPKSAHTGHTGDISGCISEDIATEVNNLNDININKKCNCPGPIDSRIVHNHPFYYCRWYTDFKNSLYN
jgi:hypothetical protein